MTTARFAIVGAAGRMGLEIARLAATRDDLRLAAAVERPGNPALGADIGELCGHGPCGVRITADLPAALRQVDVAIELTSPLATAETAHAAALAGVALVSGTTGLGDPQRRALDEAAQKVPVLATSNLSPGIGVLRVILAQAIRALGPGYDIEIIEMHHRGKVDAPSGTAWDLARVAADARVSATEIRHGRSGPTGPRNADEIGMHAVRGGGVFGDHTVVLASMEERLELTHRANSRALFGQGALLAAAFLVDKKPGLYTMADVLGLSDHPSAVLEPATSGR